METRLLINKDMRKIRLVTFKPLCYNLQGINAIKKYNLKPFIDSSCRREPDMENEYPSISALCRGNKLAPQLKKDDIVVYLTKLPKYKCSKEYLTTDEYKLVSILKVIKVCESHTEAEKWYNNKNYNLPSNCMVEANNPIPFDKTGGNFLSQKEYKNYHKNPIDRIEKWNIDRIEKWDKDYQERANNFKQFNITHAIYKDLETPISITKDNLISWFGKVPSTQTSKIIEESIYNKIIEEKLVPLGFTDSEFK